MRKFSHVRFGQSKLVSLVTVVTFLVCLCLIIGGCAGTIKELKGFKQHDAAGDYQWITSQEVACKAGQEGCNQVHLIKGNACLILASKSSEENEQIRLYSCAADELEKGISQTQEWQIKDLDLDRPQTYENYCQALSALQDMQAGEEAKGTGARLYSAAQEFHRLEPDHYGADYFYALARLRQLQQQMVSDPENEAQHCEQIKQILNDVEAVIAKAEKDPDTSWTDRYRQNFQDLRAILKLEIEGCS